MFVVPCKWRELLPPEAQERFDDVNEQRVLGASSHIRIIGDIFLSIAENGADDPLPLLRGIADHFIATRGESSQAITNAIGLMLRNVHGSSRAELAQSIRKGVECYRTEAAKDLEKIRSLLWTVLEGKRTLLLYDYSSTVAAISALGQEHGVSFRCIVPESRALDGGRPYVAPLLRAGHSVHVIPDCALYQYIPACDAAFIGSETYYPDGTCFNTVGSELTALLCSRFHVPFYVPTPLLKLDLRALDGYRKKPILDDHRQRIGGRRNGRRGLRLPGACGHCTGVHHRLYHRGRHSSADGHVYRRAELCCKTGRCERMKGRVIGMVQTRPLPGSYRNRGERISFITEQALEETRILAECGVQSVILQNMGDMPIRQQSAPEAIAYLSVVAQAIRRSFPALCLGVLVNWDGVAALAVADAAGADFVRVEHLYTGAEVTSAGLLQGQCCEITALKRKLGTDIPVYADVWERHGIPLCPQPLDEAAWQCVHEAFADGLFLCGKNAQESLSMARQVRQRVPGIPLFLGGGATGDNVRELLQEYDAVCVATWIKNGDMRNPVDPDRTRYFMEQAALAEVGA